MPRHWHGDDSLQLFLRFPLRATGDDRHQVQHLDCIDRSAELDSTPAKAIDKLPRRFWRPAGDKDAFRMARRKFLPAAGRPGLKEHRGALRRGFTKMDPINPVMTPLVQHGANPRRIGEDAPFTIAPNGIIRPTALPKLVENLEILLCGFIARIMIGLPRQPHAAGSAVEITGHDVPADPALRQMVERRHAAREQKGWLICRVDIRRTGFGDRSQAPEA